MARDELVAAAMPLVELMKRSSLAEPPIAMDECDALNVAICRYHNGRIAHSPTGNDRHGNVYWCPVGSMFWHYSERRAGLHAPLNFPRGM